MYIFSECGKDFSSQFIGVGNTSNKNKRAEHINEMERTVLYVIIQIVSAEKSLICFL